MLLAHHDVIFENSIEFSKMAELPLLLFIRQAKPEHMFFDLLNSDLTQKPLVSEGTCIGNLLLYFDQTGFTNYQLVRLQDVDKTSKKSIWIAPLFF